MKSKPLFFFVLFLVGLFVFFKVDHMLRGGVLAIGDRVKGAVFDTQEWLVQSYQTYFDQAATIEELREQVHDATQIRFERDELRSELEQILRFYNLPSFTSSQFTPIRSISYVEVGNYDRVWLTDYEGEEGRLYGLVSGGYVVGVAKMTDHERMVGYLNGDSLCSYGVFIGKSRSLGIIRGKNHQILIDFIPLGSEINVGDEVVTNGMDDVFFAEIPVGKVIKIHEKNGFLSAEIEPYAKNYGLGYMWLLDRSKDD
ncbi:rod shape-determining protein MreC [Helicobacter pametensis]|uniref:rod shape-determining protein MreC n=1 Tax=Helicobacter pametensis TaxID=95149 RepID=UPI0004810FD1|nr:rod shape-determining protein MreC [Helicobacter pametensis]